MRPRLLAAGTLAVVGGFLMVASGYVSHGILFIALGYAQTEVPAYLTGLAAGAASLSIFVLEFIIALGGLTVLVGGLIMLSGHARTGRVFVYLGGGAGLIGLLLSFGLTVFRLGPASAFAYAPYWVGLVMAVASRRIAKGV